MVVLVGLFGGGNKTSIDTGCRSGAACSLLVTDVCDKTSGDESSLVMKSIGRVEEKGAVWREFVIE